MVRGSDKVMFTADKKTGRTVVANNAGQLGEVTTAEARERIARLLAAGWRMA